MSLDVDVRDAAGATVGTASLDEGWFGIEPNVAVLHQVVTAQLAAARAGTQSTKTRAEVSGGGKKPFKQKGTGRARQGSERAPHFTGGGIALGPKPRSYKQRTPRKMINLALRSALSDRRSEDRVAVVASWAWDEPTTKGARTALSALGVDGKVLVVLSSDDERTYRSFRNLPDIQVILAGELNAYDVLCNDWVVFTSATLPGHAEQGDATVELGSTRTPAPQPSAAEAAAPPVAEVEPQTDVLGGTGEVFAGAGDDDAEIAVADAAPVLTDDATSETDADGAAADTEDTK